MDSISRRAFLSIPFAARLAAEVEDSGWEELNFGGGGQIQDIVLDPNTPGRAYYLSDMEGLYRTDDYGETWRYIGAEASTSNCLTAAVEPGNSNRVYLGTLHGIQISDDAGEHWEPLIEAVAGQNGEAIQVIAIDPADPTRIYAGPGGTFRWTANQHPPLNTAARQQVSGEPSVWVSTDRGATWIERKLASGVDVRREVFSIAVSTKRPGEVWAANRGLGLFRSKDGGETWIQQPKPAEVETSECWGCALSPDGEAVYAVFRRNSQSDATLLFASPSETVSWRSVSVNGLPSQSYRYWKPKADPRSKGLLHRLLLPQCAGARSPLFEIEVHWSPGFANVESHEWKRAFWHSGVQSGTAFDIGWERYQSRPLAAEYTPASWPRRGIWSTADQTLFSGEADERRTPEAWTPVYTRLAGEANGLKTYASRGAHCTYHFDADQLGDYLAVGCGDVGLVESYDGGGSWTVDGAPFGNRSNCVTIHRGYDPPLAVAHIGTGFGANSFDGTLYAKRLASRLPWNGSSGDRWIAIAGGRNEVAALPNMTVLSMAPKAFSVYNGLTQTGGVFLVDDIEALYQAALDRRTPPPFRRINPSNWTAANSLAADPVEEGVLWARPGGGFWRGEPNGGSYTWRQIRRDVAEFAVWAFAGKTVLAVAPRAGEGVPLLELSFDSGVTWNRVLEMEETAGEGRLINPTWWQRNPVRLAARGIAGSDRHVVLALASWSPLAKAAGVLLGELSGTSVSWRDWTGEIHFPMFSHTRIVEERGERFFLGPTQGNGLWRKKLPE